MSLTDIVSEIEATLDGGNSIPPSTLPRFQERIRGASQTACFEAFLPTIHKIAVHLKWFRYSLQRGLEPEAIEAADEHWNQLCAKQTGNFQEILTEITQYCTENRTRHSDLRRQLREIEQHLGFSDDLVKGVTSLFPPSLQRWDRSASIAELLPFELLPTNEESAGYDHTLHQIVECWLSQIGQELRRHDQVVELFGHALVRLFPIEDDHPDGSFRFKQICLLVDRYMQDHNYDVFALMWRGELSYWQGDNDLGNEYATQFWEQSAHFNSSMNTRAIRLLARQTDFLKDELKWKEPSSPGPYSHLRDLSDWWLDREESLAAAFVRRCFDGGNWDTDTVLAVNELNHSGLLIDFNSLPAAVWVWISEYDCYGMDGHEFYYQAWQNAYLSSESSIASPSSVLSCIVVLAGHLLHGHMWTNATNISSVICRIQQLLPTVHGKIAARCIAFAGQVLREISPRHLKAADRLAIQSALESTTGGSDEEGIDEEALALASDAVAIDYGSELSDSEDVCKQLIGEQLWELLTQETRRYFARGHLNYLKEFCLPGEEGDFGGAFLQFSNGLQKEIHEKLVKTLLNCSDVKREVRDAIGQDPSRIEWASLWRLLEKMSSGQCQKAVKILLASGVRVDSLMTMCGEMVMTLKPMRDANPHFQRIDREQATILYDKVLKHGLATKILGTLHGRAIS